MNINKKGEVNSGNLHVLIIYWYRISSPLIGSWVCNSISFGSENGVARNDVVCLFGEASDELGRGSKKYPDSVSILSQKINLKKQGIEPFRIPLRFL
jgi:hypothetical protein